MELSTVTMNTQLLHPWPVYASCSKCWVEQSVAAHANNVGNKNEERDTFSEVQHKHDNPFVSLECTHYQVYNIGYNAMNEKHPTTCCFPSKTPRTQQVEHWWYPKRSSDFISCHQPGRYIGTRKIFAYLGFFAKVSVLVYPQFLGLIYYIDKKLKCNTSIKMYKKNQLRFL